MSEPLKWSSTIDNEDMSMILYSIVKRPELHHQWLYTLSYLENCGARKIKQMEGSLFSNLMILKHGAEEARHAYFFRRQILKLKRNPDEKLPLLGGIRAKNYLNLLDVKISKVCKQILGLEKEALKWASYLLTTFTVEVRAGWLFEAYQELLDKKELNINLATVLKEEENHLQEMVEEIEKMEKLHQLLPLCLEIEGELFFNLFESIKKDLQWKSSQDKLRESHSEMKTMGTPS